MSNLNIKAERREFEAWFEQEYPIIDGRRPKYQAETVGRLMFAAWQAARRAAPSSSSDELPPLPPAFMDLYSPTVRKAWEAQMQEYARSAIAADRRARQGGTEYAATAADWSEDFSHENGNYESRCADCGIGFMGHKRRTVCRVCAAIQAAAPADAPILATVKRFLEDMHAMPVDWTIAESQKLHKQVCDAMAGAPAEDAREQQPTGDAVGRAALMEFIDKYCLNKPELVSVAESAFYWFNKCCRATGTDRAQAGDKSA